MRGVREKSGMSLADVGKSAGISRGAVWRMETSGYPLPRGRTLERVLRYGYGLDATDGIYVSIVSRWTQERLGSSVHPRIPQGRAAVIERIAGLSRSHFLTLAALSSDPGLLDLVSAMVRAHRRAAV